MQLLSRTYNFSQIILVVDNIDNIEYKTPQMKYHFDSMP